MNDTFAPNPEFTLFIYRIIVHNGSGTPYSFVPLQNSTESGRFMKTKWLFRQP